MPQDVMSIPNNNRRAGSKYHVNELDAFFTLALWVCGIHAMRRLLTAKNSSMECCWTQTETFLQKKFAFANTSRQKINEPLTNARI